MMLASCLAFVKPAISRHGMHQFVMRADKGFPVFHKYDFPYLREMIQSVRNEKYDFIRRIIAQICKYGVLRFAVERIVQQKLFDAKV